MRLLSKTVLSFVLALGGLASFGAECEIGIGIAPISGGDDVSANVARQLEAKLRTALAHRGVAAGDYDCQFFLTGRFDHSYTQEASGVGGRVLVKTDLQLAICDGDNKKVYAIATFPLKGVGGTDTQALTKALSSLNVNNKEFINFVEEGKQKIIDYYNNNYPTYLTKAKTALNSRSYDEALYWATSIPECSNGYGQAVALVNTITTDQVNYDGAQLLAAARAEWAADPTASGAERALSYLSQIDPNATCAGEAKNLGNQIAKTVQKQWEFENVTKYKDELALRNKMVDQAHAREQSRIAAAKAIGVAWAKNQPKTIVKHNWIVW